MRRSGQGVDEPGVKFRPATALLVAISLSVASACGPFGGGDDSSADGAAVDAAANAEDVGANAEDVGAADAAEQPATEELAAGVTPTTAKAKTKTATPAVHWSYEGEEGPDHWGELDPAYEACATGLEQSPIDLTAGKAAKLDDIEFKWKPSAYEVVDNGHTVQVNLATGGTAVIDGHEYTLVQFHFHAPSEHTIAGTRYTMEMHFVHKDAEGKLAVVGVLFTEAAENPELNFVFDRIPAPGSTLAGQGLIDPRRLLPEYTATVRYPGSLTTPPCSEGVSWNVFLMPIQASKEQIETFASRHEGSNRPVQSIGDRIPQVDLAAP